MITFTYHKNRITPVIWTFIFFFVIVTVSTVMQLLNSETLFQVVSSSFDLLTFCVGTFLLLFSSILDKEILTVKSLKGITLKYHEFEVVITKISSIFLQLLGLALYLIYWAILALYFSYRMLITDGKEFYMYLFLTAASVVMAIITRLLFAIPRMEFENLKNSEEARTIDAIVEEHEISDTSIWEGKSTPQNDWYIPPRTTPYE